MAKRYDAQIYRGGPIESVVLAADYNAIEARVVALEAALREADSFMDDAPTVRAIIRKALGIPPGTFIGSPAETEGDENGP